MTSYYCVYKFKLLLKCVYADTDKIYVQLKHVNRLDGKYENLSHKCKIQ